MTTCPYCNSTGFSIREFQRRGDETLHLWGCRDCACEFLEPQPSDSWLAHEYAGYFQMRQSRVPASKSRLCQLILSKVAPMQADAHILDIGGGEGYFVEETLRAAPNVKMTLIEPQADEKLAASGRVTVHRKLVEEWLSSTPPEQYDIIVAMDLIEHLRRPLEVMKEVVDTRLKVGGTLIMTTPDAASGFRKVLGPLWPHYKVEHLTYPSPRALQKFADRAGLSVRECSSLAKPLPLGYMIAVLRNFGPSAVRAVGRCVDLLCPSAIRGVHVRIPSGELLFVATKRG
jgi:hypothetical protein